MILLTGISGAVGSAIRSALNGYRIIGGVHSRVPSESGRYLRIDVTKPHLGLDDETYVRLCDEVEIIIHSAGVVDLIESATIRDVNVEGVRNIVELASDSSATLFHVSTAYVRDHLDATELISEYQTLAWPANYVATKRAGDRVVQESGVRSVVVRPSLMIGDSKSGKMSRPQGLHAFTKALLRSQLPFVPGVGGNFGDVVPQDIVATAIRDLIDSDVKEGDYWLTAGPAAMRFERLIDIVAEVRAEFGYGDKQIRIIEPSIMDRLIKPVFSDGEFGSLIEKFERVAQINEMATTVAPLPTSYGNTSELRSPVTNQMIEDGWRNYVRAIATEIGKG